MVGGIKRIKILAGKETEFEMFFNKLRQEIKNNEPGNIYYDLYRSQIEPLRYIVMERYRDQAALDAHKNSVHGALFFPKIREILEQLEVEYFDSVD